MGFLLLASTRNLQQMGMLRYTSGGQLHDPHVCEAPAAWAASFGAEHSQRLEAYFHAVPGIKSCGEHPHQRKGLMRPPFRGQQPRALLQSMCCSTNLARVNCRGDNLRPRTRPEVVREPRRHDPPYSRIASHCLKAVQQLRRPRGVMWADRPVSLKAIRSRGRRSRARSARPTKCGGGGML